MANKIKTAVQTFFHLFGYTALKRSTLADLSHTNTTLREELLIVRAQCSTLLMQTEQLREDMARGLAQISHLELKLSRQTDLPPMPEVEPEFAQTGFATAALQKLIQDFDFHTVLDVGAGSLAHSKVFARHGKAVTAVDFGTSVYHHQRTAESSGEVLEVLGDFNEITFASQFDCVWASHVLEHQVDVHTFLKKVASHVKEDGILAISVPPLKHEIVGGHVSLWNAGLLLYRLVLAGLDCSEASLLAYGYNITVLVKKRTIADMGNLGLQFDAGDIRKLRRYLPPSIEFRSNDVDDPFDGNLRSINWSGSSALQSPSEPLRN